MSEKTDEELMLAYQKGEAHAFLALYRRHHGRVFGYMKKRVQNTMLAEDLLQNVFFKLHQSRAQYDGRFPFLPWLFVICRSALIDAHRRGNRLEQTHAVPLEEGHLTSQSSAGSEQEDFTGLLSGAQQQLVRWRYQDDLPFQEIAKRLGISENTASQRLSRAIRRLRRLLSNTDMGKKPEEEKS